MLRYFIYSRRHPLIIKNEIIQKTKTGSIHQSKMEPVLIFWFCLHFWWSHPFPKHLTNYK